MKIIELKPEFRGRSAQGTSFTGRPEGYSVRSKLKLSELDKDMESYSIQMPADTTTFNPSFYLGLLYESIKTLGWKKFKEKYSFDLSNMSSSLRVEILRNLEDCERKAQNEIEGLTGLD